MITANHPKKKYKENGLVNGARGYIDSIQPSKEDPDVAEIVWVCFNDPKIGQLLRFDASSLRTKNIPSDKLAVPIMKQKRPFRIKQGNTSYVRDQFPLTICYAVTCYKSQGQTLEETLIDFTDASRIDEGSFYTAMSRVKYGCNLYLKDFKIEYVKPVHDAEMIIKKMQMYQVHALKKIRNTENVFESAINEMKLGYVNINNLATSNSTAFLNNDQNIVQLDYLAVADTRLTNKTKTSDLEKQLSNWTIEARLDADDGVLHMGLLFLRSKESRCSNLIELIQPKSLKKNDVVWLQILMIKFKEYDLTGAFLYSREKPTLHQLKEMKKELTWCDLIIGDINLDPSTAADSKKLEELCGNKTRVLNEVTTTRFNQLDHIILDCEKFPKYFTTSFLNHSTDHSLICLRIAHSDNSFHEKFLKKRHFDEEKRTKNKGVKRVSTPRTFDVNRSKRIKVFEGEDNFEVINSDSDDDDDVDMEENSEELGSLKYLYSPNWLRDENINAYMKLLTENRHETFSFTSFFYPAFTYGGFDRVKNYHKKVNIWSLKKIFFPIHIVDHWFLVMFDGTCLQSFDPYNDPGTPIEKNYEQHDDILTNLRDTYLRPLFAKYKKPWKDVQIKVSMPPEIPCQENGYDCGVFLLTFAKYLVLGKEFDFTTNDMIFMRDSIRKELEEKKIIIDESNVVLANTKQVEVSKKKLSRKRKAEPIPRTFMNPDVETCWLNTGLQLILTAMDFKENLDPEGSVLWKLLLSLKTKDTIKSINPMDVKRLLLQTEIERLKQNGLTKEDCAFVLPQKLNLSKSSATLSSQKIGYQDCVDFFYCLERNKEDWPDVYNLFSTSTITETECYHCGNISRQDFPESDLVFRLSCPRFDMTMQDCISMHFQNFETLKDWKDEDGCQKKGGRRRVKLYDLDQTEYLVVVLNRLERLPNGDPDIISSKISVNRESKIKLMDINGNSKSFTPLAIVIIEGTLEDNQFKYGHYLAEVKNMETGYWFRTSDASKPKCLAGKELSDLGYLYLFKKD